MASSALSSSTSSSASISASSIRALYRALLRQSSQFANYNFRTYARRRTVDAFREHAREADPQRVHELVARARQDLAMLKRQTIVSQFYQLDKLVVEGGKTGKQSGSRGDIVRQKDTGWN